MNTSWCLWLTLCSGDGKCFRRWSLDLALSKPIHPFIQLHSLISRFDGKKKRPGSRDQQEKLRLVHKHKKELKGAVRSIRQDNQFLAREKLNEQVEKSVSELKIVNMFSCCFCQICARYKIANVNIYRGYQKNVTVGILAYTRL